MVSNVTNILLGVWKGYGNMGVEIAFKLLSDWDMYSFNAAQILWSK